MDALQGRDVDLLFGLDMLKAHQAIIDLEKNVLRISGREVRFLAEHELPEQARMMEIPVDAPHPSESASTSAIHQPPGAPLHFPGAGQTLGSRAGRSVPAVAPSASGQLNSNIKTLMDLGMSHSEAVAALDAAGGNVDLAAAQFFN